MWKGRALHPLALHTRHICTTHRSSPTRQLPAARPARAAQSHNMQTSLAQGQAFQAGPAGLRLRGRRACTTRAVAAPEKLQRPDKSGRYGKFGGKYVPETLIPALAELEVAYKQAQADPTFQVRVQALVRRAAGRDGSVRWPGQTGWPRSAPGAPPGRAIGFPRLC